jgi:Flp pilus assembly protein CpaB
MNVGRSGAVPTRNRWIGRVSGAHVVVVLAGLLGGVLTLAALRADAREVRVLTAAHDLQVGASIDAADVRAVVVRGDVAALPTLLHDGQQSQLVGDIVVAPVRRGDPLRRSDVTAPAASGGARAVSFAVDAADAVAGDVGAGDRVDVLAVARDGHAAGYVLVGAPVLATSAPRRSGPLRTDDNRLVLTVAVSGDDALGLAAALANARVIVVKATGATRLGRVPRYLPSGGSGSGG